MGNLISLQVWAVLKPGFLALLEDPYDTNLLDIIIFDVLPSSDGNGEGRVLLAKETKERNPLRFGFQVCQPLILFQFCFSFLLFLSNCLYGVYFYIPRQPVQVQCIAMLVMIALLSQLYGPIEFAQSAKQRHCFSNRIININRKFSTQEFIPLYVCGDVDDLNHSYMIYMNSSSFSASSMQVLKFSALFDDLES